MSSLFLYSRLWWFVQVSVVSTTRRYFWRLYAMATNCVLSRSRIYFSHSHVSFLCGFCVEKWTRNVNDAIARKYPYFWAYIKIWNYCSFEEVVIKIELTYSNGSIWPRGPPPPIFCFPHELEKRFRFVIFFSGYYILNTFSEQLGVQVSESSKVLKTFSDSPDRIYYIQHSNKFHWNWKCSYCKRLTHWMDSVETISYSKIVALNQLSTFFCHFCWRPILSWVFFESNSQLVYIVY